ncbi:hypothetical protein BJ912DRAFT_1124225, partial [Pholiota molesta]
METQSPSRKRRRTDADGSENLEGEPKEDIVENEDVIPTSHDGTYYRVDGDCVIRVEDVLFKAPHQPNANAVQIHRYLLVRDSSVFSDMFSMPQESGSSNQGITDEDPVVLHDEVADFRALCWSIYALPTEYMDQADESKVDIEQLVSLYLIAQKYQFKSHEKFARGLLRTHCSNISGKPAEIQEYFISCSQERLEALMKITSLTNEATDLSLGSIIQAVWLFRFIQKPEESMSYAVGVAETLGLRSFMGKLYYQLLTTAHSERYEGSVAYEDPVNDLTPPQKSAFFLGHWSLQQYWSDLMKAPRKKFSCPSSQPSHDCNRVWKDLWPKFKLKMIGDSLDPVFDLKSYRQMVLSASIVCIETVSVKNISCAESYINEMIMELENSLADHFLGPLPSIAPAEEAE